MLRLSCQQEELITLQPEWARLGMSTELTKIQKKNSRNSSFLPNSHCTTCYRRTRAAAMASPMAISLIAFNLFIALIIFLLSIAFSILGCYQPLSLATASATQCMAAASRPAGSYKGLAPPGALLPYRLPVRGLDR